jgi:peptidoglycan hydrolase-like protein with peptidoglycan-binding domain
MARMLAEGATGDDVQMLQAVLNYHRLPNDEVLSVDGIFGPRTAERVRAFQALNQLDVDGIVGPNTGGALMTICQFSAEYVATREQGEAIGDTPTADDTQITREYELKNGVAVTLNPWEKPPAKLQYTLDFEGAFVIKNPRLPAKLFIGVGAELGRTIGELSPEHPYRYSGAGRVLAKFEKDYTLGPIKLDSSLQLQIEAENEFDSPKVKTKSQLSLGSGISFEIVKERFFLFTEGEVGAVVQWGPGKVQPSMQWEGIGGLKLKF